MKPPLLFCASLAAGFGVGLVIHKALPPSRDAGSELRPGAGSSSEAGSRSGGTGVAGGAGGQPVSLLNVSSGDAFRALPVEKQRDALIRLSARISKGGTCSDQLLLARVVNELSFEQAAALREALSKNNKSKSNTSDKARAALAERLAALDPVRTLDLGREAADPRTTQAAISALAQKDGAAALRAFAQLPEKFQTTVATEMKSGFTDGLGKATGSLSDMAAVVKENPRLMDSKSPGEGTVRRLIGQVASQAALSDPASAMAAVRQMASQMVQVKTGEDPKAAESYIVARIASQMTRTLRTDSIGSERAIFNSLADNEKNDVMVAMEAASRFRGGGVEEAIQFAEKQGTEQNTKNAASGVWFSLAQQDRSAALRWIESLPEGAFRDGALSSVMQESAFRNRSFGDLDQSVKAGAELLSASSRLDYFALLAAQRKGTGLSQSEFISNLPLTDSDKTELRRRLAPLRAR